MINDEALSLPTPTASDAGEELYQAKCKIAELTERLIDQDSLIAEIKQSLGKLDALRYRKGGGGEGKRGE